MGFLDKLWDETLAGPTPETGLGRLRKYNSLSAVRSPNHPIVNVATNYHDHNNNDNQTAQISRSITILRLKSLTIEPEAGSGSGSGSESSTPTSGPSSPFSPNGDPDVKRFTRKKPAFDSMDHASKPSSPTVYDWIMIGALDR